MNDDRDDDSDYRGGFPFFTGFGGFGSFFGDMDRQFKDMDKMFEDMNRHIEEMTKQMGDGFKDFGEIRTGFHPPGIGGNIPPLKQDPRDQMLKGNDEDRSRVTKSPPSDSRLFAWNPPEISIITGDGGNTYFSGRSIQTVRHADGSVERIEKTTTNGQTCTTVTKTDPNGVSTTTTTCDRPAIEGPPKLTSPDSSSKISPPPNVTGTNVPSINNELTKDDAGFFSRLFGNFGFKPKS